eukprot:scaffold1453_cov195-Amphora_coffeaeformis.AAC.11
MRYSPTLADELMGRFLTLSCPIHNSAFWWIIGDCLGFRRDTGISPTTEQPYKFASELRQEYQNNILPYEDQVSCLLSHGFGLWDIVSSCERAGSNGKPSSLDSDIRNAKVNKIREFASANPSLRRIVFSNGAAAFKLFKQNFPDWCDSGELRANCDPYSQKAVGKKLEGTDQSRITVVVAMSPSPAAASKSYTQKRNFWEEHVFEPGVNDHQAWRGDRHSC